MALRRPNAAQVVLPRINALLLLALFFCAQIVAVPTLGQKTDADKAQVPPELQGAKVYTLPEEGQAGSTVESPIIYKNLVYRSLDLRQLGLDLSVGIKPVDRSATVRRIYFKDIRASGIPVHVEPFDQEFKLSKQAPVDIPAPLKCSIEFAELDSFKPVQEIVEKDKLRITGRTFIEVKLNPIEKLALRTKQLVLAVDLDDEVPLQMFSGNPLLQMTANKILATLSDPTSIPAIALAKEHLENLAATKSLMDFGRTSVYLVYCEYVLRAPEKHFAEKFIRTGTGFLASADGKLLTAKRVVEPWKFDAEAAFLMKRFQLQLDQKSYRICVWPPGARVLSTDGQPDFETAVSTQEQTLKLLKCAPDRMEEREYLDPSSRLRETLTLHVSGEGDTTVLQLSGTGFRPLAFARSPNDHVENARSALLSYPYGLSQSLADPHLDFVKVSKRGSLIELDRQLGPGESGAPLLTPAGKVLGLASSANECIPVEVLNGLIQ